MNIGVFSNILSHAPIRIDQTMDFYGLSFNRRQFVEISVIQIPSIGNPRLIQLDQNLSRKLPTRILNPLLILQSHLLQYKFNTQVFLKKVFLMNLPILDLLSFFLPGLDVIIIRKLATGLLITLLNPWIMSDMSMHLRRTLQGVLLRNMATQ